MVLNHNAIVWFSIGTISSTIGVLCLSYFYMKEKGKLCICKNRAKGKVIAITGANSGIGYEVALKLATLGAKIYVCCRNSISGEAAVKSIVKQSGNSLVYFVSLDVSNFCSCQQFVEFLLQEETKLDILIHNAGVFHVDPYLTDDGFEITAQTNFLGPVYLTENLYPLLLESPSSRVIFVSSEAHKIPSLESVGEINFKNVPLVPQFEDYVLQYGFSKLALKLYATYLAEINKGLEIRIASVNPGNVWTPVYRSCWTHWYHWPFRLLLSLFMRSPLIGAQSIIHAVNVDKITTGCYIKDCYELGTYEEKELNSAQYLMKKVFSILDIK